MKNAKRFLITGTVQGIFFRQFCKEEATKLGLRGYVRSLESGEIEVLVEGSRESIDSLFEVLKKGPPHAQIRKIAIEEKKWTGNFKDFSIVKF